MDKIKTTKSNDEFLAEIAKAPTPAGLRPSCQTKENRTMKADIHPKYEDATVRCSCGNTFTTRSTKAELHVELCNECHPFYTGKQKLVDTGGRVERFERRYGNRAASQGRQEGVGPRPSNWCTSAAWAGEASPVRVGGRIDRVPPVA